MRFCVTSDTHGGLASFHGDCALPRLAGAIGRARSEAPTLVLDNGDTFFGGPLATAAARCLPRDNPIGRTFAQIRFDAVNLGNEDLQLGLDRYAELMRRHDLPALSTNLLRQDEVARAEPIAAAIRLEVWSRTAGRVRVGVLGAVPASACPSTGGVRFAPLLPRLAAEVNALRDTGCELVVVLCHSGLAGGAGFPAEEAASLAVASLPGVDLVVAGHLHELAVCRTQGRAVVVAPGSFGRHLGLVDFELRRGAGLEVGSARVALQPVDDLPVEQSVERVLAPHVERLRESGATRIGAAETELSTEFAPFVVPSFVRFMEGCITRHVEASTGRDDVLVATQCSGGLGPLPWTSVPRGPVTESGLARLFPYHNELLLLELTGSALQEWLEISARIFRPLAPGRSWQPVLDETVPLCDHDYFSGVELTVDLGRTGSRIVAARWRGQALRPSRRYLVAMSSYRCARLMAQCEGARRLTRLAPSVQRLLRDAFSAPQDLPPGPRRIILDSARGRHLYFRAKAPAGAAAPFGLRRVCPAIVELAAGDTVYEFRPGTERP